MLLNKLFWSSTEWNGNKSHPFNNRRGRLKGPIYIYIYLYIQGEPKLLLQKNMVDIVS